MTGRTHQIRVHMKYLGYPIVSDPIYLNKKVYEADKVWCPRLFLHAAEITFTHPVTGQPVDVKSPIPNDLELALKKLVH